jgi:hypothetical protein
LEGAAPTIRKKFSLTYFTPLNLLRMNVKSIAKIKNHTSSCCNAEFSPTGTRLATAYPDWSIIIHDTIVRHPDAP